MQNKTLLTDKGRYKILVQSLQAQENNNYSKEVNLGLTSILTINYPTIKINGKNYRCSHCGNQKAE